MLEWLLRPKVNGLEDFIHKQNGAANRPYPASRGISSVGQRPEQMHVKKQSLLVGGKCLLFTSVAPVGTSQ